MRWSLAIHGPGLGSRERNAGTKATRRKGIANPNPRAAKTMIEPASGSSKAVPSATPRNGPAQGVATKAASAPVPKLPAGRAPPASTGSSNTRSRLSVIAVTSSSSRRMVRGSWSWNAQPAALPPARIASNKAPSAPVPTTAPAA